MARSQRASMEKELLWSGDGVDYNSPHEKNPACCAVCRRGLGVRLAVIRARAAARRSHRSRRSRSRRAQRDSDQARQLAVRRKRINEALQVRLLQQSQARETARALQAGQGRRSRQGRVRSPGPPDGLDPPSVQEVRPSADRFERNVHTGANRLEASTVNAFGVTGAVSTAEIRVKG